MAVHGVRPEGGSPASAVEWPLRVNSIKESLKFISPKSLKFTGSGKRRHASGRTWREAPRLSGASDNSSHLRTSDWSLNEVDVKSKL
jgi:hypothetical protein